MATTNHLSVSFDRGKIDEFFDFFLIATSEKYIPGGAYIIDKPIEKLKAESVVFDNGRTMFVMFKKHIISRLKLIDALEDEKITLKQLQSNDIKDYILLRLFLNSINNFECEGLKFNNITGKLFIVIPKWINKNKSGFKALNVSIDSEMYITGEAVGFTNLALFKDKKKLANYPKYTFSNKNNALKRVLPSTEEKDIFVRKSLFGKKAEIPYLSLSPKEINECKVYFIYLILDILGTRYKEFLNMTLQEIKIEKKVIDYLDVKFMDKAMADFNSRETNVISYVVEPEYQSEYYELLNTLTSKTKSVITNATEPALQKNNIVFIHNKDYYTDNLYEDPYQKINRNAAIQCITVEDSIEKIIKDNNAVFNSTIKELVIKNDILHKHQFTLDDWSQFNFKKDWIIGKEKDGKHYFIIIKPDGQFDFVKKLNDFDSFGNIELDECSDYLTANIGKEKVVISNGEGDLIVISRTNRMILPSKEIFTLEKISRSKESREKYLSGVVDINYFEYDDGLFCYNAGLKGSGMNTAIPKASLLYKVDVVKGKNIMPEILKTMSASFVKYKMFTVLPYPIKYLNEYILLQSER